LFGQRQLAQLKLAATAASAFLADDAMLQAI